MFVEDAILFDKKVDISVEKVSLIINKGPPPPRPEKILPGPKDFSGLGQFFSDLAIFAGLEALAGGL